jgi:vacuolar-type H+-ATPase subunit H
MKPQEMLENLTKQAEELRQDILQTEQSFIQKKEQFIRLQGAIEALNLVLQEEEAPTVVPTEVVAPE